MTEMKSDAATATSDVDIVALKPGALIGRHEVLAVLGQGGFGITYRARDSQLNREVAIKEYLPTSLAYRADGMTVLPRSTKVAEDFTWGRDRFVAEGQTLANLHHAPGIVRVFDFLEINGTAYIVMEMLRGDTLEARIKREGPLDPTSVDRILSTLLDGLEQVHAAGFLHRDIKPANILLDSKGNPTLIDFGASRAAMAGRTTALTAIFTPGYAAAEQMTSARQGPWTDIYSLSATLYHAITGRTPPNAFDRMLDDEYEPLAKIAPPGFTPGLIAGVDTGLAVRASDRPQSIAGWRTVLSMASPADGAATQLASRTIDPAATIVSRTPTIQPAPARPTVSPPPAPATPPPVADVATPPTPPARSRMLLYAGIAAALLLLAGGGGWFALSPSRPAPPAAPGQATALQDMKVEDLERVLAERRAADAAAAEKKRLEEEARRKAEADAASKLAADAELAKAEAARKQAEEELAKLKAEIEARRQDDTQAQALARRAEAEAAQRKAEAEMAALRQAEDDARKKAAAEAKAKHEADEALAKAQAERQKADEEAKRKAAAETKEKAEASTKQIAEAEAKAKAEADAKAKADAEAKSKADAEAAAAADKKAAEAAETALRLAPADRQRVQVALTSLGFDTRGSDGALGPRSREMISAWQRARNQPVTGFLDGAQHQALLREAVPALQKYDEEQKKKEEEAKAKAAATAFDGTYGGAFATRSGPRPATVRIAGASGSGTLVNPRCGTAPFAIQVTPAGDVSGGGTGFDADCGPQRFDLHGKVGDGRLQLALTTPGGVNISAALALGVPAPAVPVPPPPPAPTATPTPAPASPSASTAPTAFDGRWSGGASFPNGTFQPVSIMVRDGQAAGSWRNPRCGEVTFTISIQPTGAYSAVLQGYGQGCQPSTVNRNGTIQGNALSFSFGQGGQISLKR
ncbi:MAG: hypothetical protein EPO55_03270 [Reyranella sp.]|uniref:protein kinase domain-containing protein n=1 Tax=Reyranella sp. TaxID=1929291 RepID=UPI00121694D6|nr:protein kinase [Reyranella sp.]TAJ42064.1 MAG: hypothetical protein EPO55_03270 [Reyranella sp.]